MQALRRQLVDSLRAFSNIYRNPRLRRLQLAWIGSSVGTWGYVIALMVYAYRQGGPAGVGLVGLIRWFPAAVVGVGRPRRRVHARRVPRHLRPAHSVSPRAAGVADRAKMLYGERYGEFLDNVKAFAYFPYSVAKDIDDFQNGEIGMRYKLIGGQLDQCAGILFNLKSNGDYLTVRFNAKDHNVVLWTFNKGVRKFVKKGVEDVDVPMLTWNDLKIVVKGTQLQAYMNGKFYIDYKLPEPVAGKVGLWSKTDSASYFDDYTVTLAGR